MKRKLLKSPRGVASPAKPHVKAPAPVFSVNYYATSRWNRYRALYSGNIVS